MRLKTLFLTLTLGAIAFLTNAEKTAEGQPGISFTQTTHDFGVIPENGGSVTTTFEFTNPGDGPLLILNASASCGCTRPEYPRKPVKPGKKDKITVTYNPKGRPGEFKERDCPHKRQGEEKGGAENQRQRNPGLKLR